MLSSVFRDSFVVVVAIVMEDERMNNNYTTDPLAIAVKTQIDPEYIRLPQVGSRDPVFGLSRTVLNELILPCKKNRGRPPVRSVILRRRGARTGIRLIDLKSLRAYLNQHVEPAYVDVAGSADGDASDAIATDGGFVAGLRGA